MAWLGFKEFTVSNSHTLRRLLDHQIYGSVCIVTLGFMGLLCFFDLIEELQFVQQKQTLGYGLLQASMYVLLRLPTHAYSLLPITVLIGTVLVLARMAQNSEFTILRTSGLSPFGALRQLTLLGLIFAVLTWALGDYIAPWSERQATDLKSLSTGKSILGFEGTWLRERGDDGLQNIHIKNAHSGDQTEGLTIYDIDGQGRFKSLTTADHGEYQPDSRSWLLKGVQRRILNHAENDRLHLQVQTLEQWSWQTQITPEMVAVAFLDPSRMNTVDLFEYVRYLNKNDQSSQQYEIALWKKIFYPISCLVMIILALPVAYLHPRSIQVSNLAFFGVLFGVSFILLNNVFGHIGNLNQWIPWLTAALPSIIYTSISLLTLVWLVLRQ